MNHLGEFDLCTAGTLPQAHAFDASAAAAAHLSGNPLDGSASRSYNLGDLISGTSASRSTGALAEGAPLTLRTCSNSSSGGGLALWQTWRARQTRRAPHHGTNAPSEVQLESRARPGMCIALGGSRAPKKPFAPLAVLGRCDAHDARLYTARRGTSPAARALPKDVSEATVRAAVFFYPTQAPPSPPPPPPPSACCNGTTQATTTLTTVTTGPPATPVTIGGGSIRAGYRADTLRRHIRPQSRP
jgi:hypothetical protein